MRLLLVTERYWPEPFLITDLVAGLCERGHQVDVVTAMPNYPGDVTTLGTVHGDR